MNSSEQLAIFMGRRMSNFGGNIRKAKLSLGAIRSPVTLALYSGDSRWWSGCFPGNIPNRHNNRHALIPYFEVGQHHFTEVNYDNTSQTTIGGYLCFCMITMF